MKVNEKRRQSRGDEQDGDHGRNYGKHYILVTHFWENTRMERIIFGFWESTRILLHLGRRQAWRLVTIDGKTVLETDV
jgi:hypothetical protein